MSAKAGISVRKCSICGMDNPGHGGFCIDCGASLSEGPGSRTVTTVSSQLLMLCSMVAAFAAGVAIGVTAVTVAYYGDLSGIGRVVPFASAPFTAAFICICAGSAVYSRVSRGFIWPLLGAAGFGLLISSGLWAIAESAHS